MKRTTIILATFLLALPLFSADLFAGDKADGKAQEVCPVMGGKINKDIYVDHGDKRIYLCCKGCVAAVKKNPEKYITKLEEKGVTLASAKADGKTCDAKAKSCDHKGKQCDAKAEKAGTCKTEGKACNMKKGEGHAHGHANKAEDKASEKAETKKAGGCCGCGKK